MAVNCVVKGVHVVPMGFANALLVEGDDGLTLIDAGFPGKEAAVFGAIRGLGRSPDQLKHLVFTHGHPDHIGSASAIVRETGARTYMHPLDIPIAESGGPLPMRPAPGLLRPMLCRLFFHPDERLEPVAIDHPLIAGDILPIAGGIEVIMPLGIARDRSRFCGARDECCSPAMCPRTSWALVIPSAFWRKVVRASANLPVFHSMLPASAMACLSHAMRRCVSGISGARNRRRHGSHLFWVKDRHCDLAGSTTQSGDADAEKRGLQ
jgi:hypothetical protein